MQTYTNILYTHKKKMHIHTYMMNADKHTYDTHITVTYTYVADSDIHIRSRLCKRRNLLFLTCSTRGGYWS
jgi:hypothetical protein